MKRWGVLIAVAACGSPDAGSNPDGGDGSGSAGHPMAVAINFDTLTHNEAITTQFMPNAMFSSESAAPDRVFRALHFADLSGTSLPNTSGAGIAGQFVDDITVTFPRGATLLHFNIGGVQSASSTTIAQLQLATATGTMMVAVKGGSLKVPVDLSQYGALDSMKIVSINDAAGLDFDDFAFTTSR